MLLGWSDHNVHCACANIPNGRVETLMQTRGWDGGNMRWAVLIEFTTAERTIWFRFHMIHTRATCRCANRWRRKYWETFTHVLGLFLKRYRTPRKYIFLKNTLKYKKSKVPVCSGDQMESANYFVPTHICTVTRWFAENTKGKWNSNHTLYAVTQLWRRRSRTAPLQFVLCADMACSN